MGCCSNQTIEKGVETPVGDLSRKINNLTLDEIALLIKVQSRVRGFLTRRKINTFKISVGFGTGTHNFYGADGQILQNYDNPKVQEIRNELGEFDFSNIDNQTSERNDLENKPILE
jgi:hypothetical protein